MAFQADAEFNRATFQAAVDFMGATFRGTAHFSDATFQSAALFVATIFQIGACFEDARFQNAIWFDRATFQDYARFDRAAFHGGADFRGATFNGDTSFGGAMAGSGSNVSFDLPSALLTFRRDRPFRFQECGETAYRLAKQAAQDRGDYRAAGAYHYAEQCAINHAHLWRVDCVFFSDHRFRGIRQVLPWLGEFLLARCLFGYGEKPHRSLVAGALVVLFCSLLYWGAAGIMPSRSGDLGWQSGFGEALYFSAVTFTTLGYGDLQPKPGWFRLAAGAEAAAGAALMAIFIVGLARKYTR